MLNGFDNVVENEALAHYEQLHHFSFLCQKSYVIEALLKMHLYGVKGNDLESKYL